MITIQDLYNIVGNKIANEAQKALIRNNFPPQIAEQMCNAIDGQERAEHFQRLLKEYNEWMQNQQRQQEAVQRFLREYYHLWFMVLGLWLRIKGSSIWTRSMTYSYHMQVRIKMR